MPEQLRKLAKLLLEQVESEKTARDVKCAQTLQAAIGLSFLRSKLGR